MSYDLNIYIKQPIENGSPADCETSLRTHGLDVHLPAEFDPRDHIGCVDMAVTVSLASGERPQAASTFEYFMEKHTLEAVPPEKPTLLERPKGVAPEPEIDPYSDAAADVLLICPMGYMYAYSLPLAPAFAGYLAVTYGGVITDPQSGETYTDGDALADAIRGMTEDCARNF